MHRFEFVPLSISLSWTVLTLIVAWTMRAGKRPGVSVCCLEFGSVLRLDWETRRFHACKCSGWPCICMQLPHQLEVGSQPQGETSFTTILLCLFGRSTSLQNARPKLVINQTLWKLRICETNTSFRDTQHLCLQHHCGAASFCRHVVTSSTAKYLGNTKMTWTYLER